MSSSHLRSTKDTQLQTTLLHLHSDHRQTTRGSVSHCTIPIDRITNVTKIEVLAAEIPIIFNAVDVENSAEDLPTLTGGTVTLLTLNPARRVVPGGTLQAAVMTSQMPAGVTITYDSWDQRFTFSNATINPEGFAVTVDQTNQYYLGLNGEFSVAPGETKPFPNKANIAADNKYVLLDIDCLGELTKVGIDTGNEYSVVTSNPRVFSVLSPLSSLNTVTMRVLRKDGLSQINLDDYGWSVTLKITHMI